MSQKDDEAGKLFVGGLSWETSQDTLSRFFGQFGEVVDCVVMKNNETGRSRGFGFVTFKDPRCVEDVLASGPHNLDGRTIDPKICNPRSMQKASGDHGKVKMKAQTSNSCPKIFLGGLPANITETDLANFFGTYGKVLEVVIMYDQEKKRSRGFGFLSFEKEESVEQVCGEHFVTINGKQVECKRAKPPDGRPGPRSQGNHWNGAGMGMGPGGMPPPHMGGPMGAPSMGPPHMGPMPNGMPGGMMSGAYQSGGWGPQPAASYGQGYAAPPPSPGYQGWAPSYSSYAGPQYGSPAQGGYSGYGTPGPGAYPGYTWGSPTPGTASSVSTGSNSDRGVYTQPTPQTPSNASSAGGQTAPNSSPPEPTNSTASATSQGTVKTEYASYSGTMNNYPQEASTYGPMRTYEAAATPAVDTTPSSGSQGGSYSQSSTLSQRYHPFRRQ